MMKLVATHLKGQVMRLSVSQKAIPQSFAQFFDAGGAYTTVFDCNEKVTSNHLDRLNDMPWVSLARADGKTLVVRVDPTRGMPKGYENVDNKSKLAQLISETMNG